MLVEVAHQPGRVEDIVAGDGATVGQTAALHEFSRARPDGAVLWQGIDIDNG